MIESKYLIRSYVPIYPENFEYIHKNKFGERIGKNDGAPTAYN